MEVNHKNTLAGLLFSLLIGQAHAETPSFITFTNETPLSLATSIAGLPGNGIAPSVNKTVSYYFVNIGCTASGNPENCPIEFFDKSTGEKVATVFINALTATLNSEPIFYGMYGTSYQVTGWEQSPISHISIVKRNESFTM